MNIDYVPDIEKFPHIYGKHKDGKLVIFIGAGLSALWGCKRWNEMAASLIEFCYQEGKIDYWHRDTLIKKHFAAPRKLITIAKSLLEDNKGKYIDGLRAALEPIDKRKVEHPNIFNNLLSLNASFISTNIDDHFSTLFEKSRIHINSSTFNLEPGNINHLHGVIGEPDSLVLTIDEYLSTYQNSEFRCFLEKAFLNEEYCFLFIGYGVDEMEIIDFMVEKYSKKSNASKFLDRFYVLLPFFKNEESLLGLEQLYFDQIQMKVIPFALNVKGYGQLSEIIDTWRLKLLGRDLNRDFYNFTQIIDGNL